MNVDDFIKAIRKLGKAEALKFGLRRDMAKAAMPPSIMETKRLR